MLKVKRFYMTLLETMIAMVLSSFLFVAVFGFYRQIQYVEIKSKHFQSEVFYERRVENRLHDLFTRITPLEKNKKKKIVFYTDEEGLVFGYDAGKKLDPKFSYLVLGKLMVDQNQNLCFFTWPIKKEEDEEVYPQREVLLENVESISFSFYVPKDQERKPVDPRKITGKKEKLIPYPKDAWHETWKKEYEALPPLCLLHLTRGEKKNHKKAFFAFPLVSEDYTLFYALEKK